ncbi:aldose 1-epimerase family protein [Agrobacterium vitis]|uniref:aldose 1-epimerase family protein n=1 Tax=Agrobacterium vitis TaxID=373 RepID=UPI001574BB17|nr:aldose 1-epimerase family protein [Agrobacterium vitis]NSZ17494.1 aldose 1-epimerase family protein [Agrobacterium vitis]QZO03191.1 aldose 1-epimerase family protein [Agrobacterium vitis]UJL88311.1 aldose 1-epimerase family protein [Agrobacterium vitis]
MPTLTEIGNDQLTVQISSLGAEMQSLRTKDGQSLLWHGDAAYWGGRSPILFPIVGKAADDTLLIDGKPYSMAQHGIARRREFTLLEAGADVCRHELTADDETKAAYPFNFSLVLEHRLHGAALTVAATVSNRSDTPMPYGLGFHPAFLWPLPGADGKPHTITLDNGAEPPLLRLGGGLLAEEARPSPFHAGRLVLDKSQFEEDAMIFPEGAGTKLTYRAEDAASLHFHFENLPNLALWQKPGAPFICIEPWHGMAARHGKSGELVERPYTVILAPGDSARHGFTVTVEA